MSTNDWGIAVEGAGLWGSNHDTVREILARGGIETAVHYPTLPNVSPALPRLRYVSGDLPNAERARGNVLSLPLLPTTADEERSWISVHAAPLHDRERSACEPV